MESLVFLSCCCFWEPLMMFNCVDQCKIFHKLTILVVSYIVPTILHMNLQGRTTGNLRENRQHQHHHATEINKHTNEQTLLAYQGEYHCYSSLR